MLLSEVDSSVQPYLPGMAYQGGKVRWGVWRERYCIPAKDLEMVHAKRHGSFLCSDYYCGVPHGTNQDADDSKQITSVNEIVVVMPLRDMRVDITFTHRSYKEHFMPILHPLHFRKRMCVHSRMSSFVLLSMYALFLLPCFIQTFSVVFLPSSSQHSIVHHDQGHVFERYLLSHVVDTAERSRRYTIFAA